MTLTEKRFLTSRFFGMIALSLIALWTPAVGNNRFLLAGILLLVCLPLIVWMQLRTPFGKAGWNEPVFDLIFIVSLIHLVPEAWFFALVLGTMLLGGASIAACRLGHRFYVGLMLMFASGMALAAIVHAVEHWVPAMLALLSVFPAVILYVRTEEERLTDLNQQAQMLSGLKSVAGGVAHDFNNLLTSILGNTELALLEMSPDHPARKLLRDVMDDTTRASSLSSQLLAFSGRKPGRRKIVDLGAELTTISYLMERAIPKGMALELQSQHKLFFVECDQEQIQQVVMSLIQNAAEATTDLPSTIKLSLRHESGMSGSEQWVALEVRDEGCGIPAEMLASLFEPFVTSKQHGLGLGLASAKRVIEEHGGTIEVASTEESGAILRIRLPAVRAPEESEAPEVVNLSRRKRLVLVIDDESSIRTLISRFARCLDFHTVEAKDAYEGTELFQKQSNEFAIVILDLKMPGKDGWECLQELREIRLDIPVIIASGYNPDPARHDYPNLAFLSKPFGLQDMREAFESLLDQEAIEPAEL